MWLGVFPRRWPSLCWGDSGDPGGLLLALPPPCPMPLTFTCGHSAGLLATPGPGAPGRKPGCQAQLCCSGRDPARQAWRWLAILRITSLWARKRLRSLSFSCRVRKSFFFKASKSRRA